MIRRRDTVSVRLPAPLAARARAEAAARDVTLPWLVARLVREGLDALTSPPLTLTRPPDVIGAYLEAGWTVDGEGEWHPPLTLTTRPPGPERDPDPERRGRG